MTNYLVQFWDRETSWLHSHKEIEHDSNHPDEIVKAAVQAVKDDTGEDMSTFRASVVDEDGNGVPVPEDKPEEAKPEAENKPNTSTQPDDENDRKEYDEWKRNRSAGVPDNASPVMAIPPAEDNHA